MGASEVSLFHPEIESRSGEVALMNESHLNCSLPGDRNAVNCLLIAQTIWFTEESMQLHCSSDESNTLLLNSESLTVNLKHASPFWDAVSL